MARWEDVDGVWEAELDAEGRFKSGYLVTPSPAYEAKRQADAAQAAQQATDAQAARTARRDAILAANSVPELRALMVQELGLD